MEIKKKVLLRTIAGETLLIPVEETVAEYNGLFTLTPSATVIFQTISDGGDEEAALAAVCREFEVDPETARADVEGFLEQLRSFGII